MARQVIPINRFSGISDSEKEGLTSSFLWASACDYRTDPTKLMILPRSTKDSGTVVADLVLDGDRVGTNNYFYGDAGHIYKRTSSNVWTDERTVPDSSGNGMAYFKEDDFLYYTSDKVIGRYGQISGTPAWADDFLGAQGGIPLNTASMDLESGSSMYVTAADSASLSITGDMTIEGYFKLESLPAAAAQMALVSKWNGSSDEKSYMFELAGVSAVFGDGSNGALTISTNTTDAPIDSACTGTAATYSLTATNASFATGQKLLIHQTQGTGAGKWERNEIASYTAGTITLTNALTNSYTTGAQVLVLKEYTNVTVNSGITWTAKAWNGTVGGILSFLANGTVTITGTITATGKGFRGGTSSAGNGQKNSGEGVGGVSVAQRTANTSGGGGALINNQGGAGGGGGHTNTGTDGVATSPSTPGLAGLGSYGTADLTTLVFGGGGGSAGRDIDSNYSAGANGGGAVFIIGADLTVSGSITANGSNSGNASGGASASGGAGAGGSVLIKAQTAVLGTALITAAGGTSGTAELRGGNGSIGRIHLDYYTSYTGTTSPTLDYAQDNNLVTTTTYQLRFRVSTDGTDATSEILAKGITTPVLSTWYRYAVTWDASASQAEFFVDAVSQGTSTGAKTAAYNSTALFAIGACFDDSGTATNFFDGKFDDVRIFNDIRTGSELLTYKSVEIAAGTPNLQGYWQVDSDVNDTTANANNLTLVNTPTYDTNDVPFSSPTARQDLDQELNTSGQTYTVPTTISEAVTARQSFVPTKDPQKSVEVLVADKGTGNLTLTVHDAQNRQIATATIAAANLVNGDNEFIFSSVWRPVLGQTYHFHLTVSTGTTTVTTTTTADLETVDFHTYYQFLVTDDNHPIEKFLDFLAIANGRYLAKWDGITYTPHALTFPSNYHIRCMGIWREYLALGVVVGDTITDFEYGMLFFWDGVSDTYNFYRYVPEGAINSILSGDPMYFMAGYAGDLMKFDGGNPYKIRRMPFVKNADTLSINRKALTMWRALVHIGFCSTSTSTEIQRGVYSYGTLHQRLPETLSFDYPLSLGVTQSDELEIGMLMASGTNLFTSWKNGTTYAVDVVKPSNPPAAIAVYESLITDDNKIFGEKDGRAIRGYFKSLLDGDTMALKYKIDREDDWSTQTAESTAGAKESRFPLPTGGTRFNEAQVGLIMTTTNTTSPEFYGMGFEYDDLKGERRV